MIKLFVCKIFYVFYFCRFQWTTKFFDGELFQNYGMYLQLWNTIAWVYLDQESEIMWLANISFPTIKVTLHEGNAHCIVPYSSVITNSIYLVMCDINNSYYDYCTLIYHDTINYHNICFITVWMMLTLVTHVTMKYWTTTQHSEIID